jgi:prepilin-type N-terminal cleavage/methylation domain-containing protein
MGKKVEKAKIRTLKDNSIAGHRGFTLLELTIVIFLLGFIFLLTFPNFRESIAPRDFKRAVLSLAGTLRYAQSQAATTKFKHRLNIDVRENAFWVTVEKEKGKFSRDPSSIGQPAYLPQGVIFLDVYHAERGKVREGNTYVDFSPTGWAEECTIHLRKSEQEVFTIFIKPLGGKIEVEAGYLERVKG